MTFLELLTDKIIANNSNDFKDTLIVLPNKRARRMLQQNLSAKITHPCFSPTIYSIDELLRNLSRYRLGDDIELLGLLYQAYQNLGMANQQNLSKFFSWGLTFIHDINEIDMQLADAKAVFGNLSDIKELETVFGNENLSENQKKYIDFYRKLYPLYSQFNQLLNEKELAYEGKIYKDVAEHLVDYVGKLNYKRYVFAGFQTLSPSEILVAEYFHHEHQAEFYFDTDNFYKDNYTPFIQKLRDGLKLRDFCWQFDDFAQQEKTISVVGAPKSMGQIQYAIEQLEDIKSKEGSLNDTVLVFSDESLITPFIHSYDCSQANLTMGFPLMATPAYALLSILINAKKNAQRLNNDSSKTDLPYYHRDVFSFFRNSIVSKHLFFSPQNQYVFLQNLLKSNNIFFDCEQLKCDWVAFPDLNCSPIDFVNRLIDFFESLLSHISRQDDDFDFYCISLIIDKLRVAYGQIQLFDSQLLDLDAVIFILTQLMQGISLPLKGNAAEGLQIMGLLETRTLDFKNVIILSVNEGVLPTGRSSNSLLLYEVKRHFNLPTYQEKDSVYGYHFFRLLQRAQNIHILYDNDSSTSLSEKSRFISQLEFEIKARNLNNIKFSEKCLSGVLPENPISKIICVKKTDEVVRTLKEKEYSYSHLIEYVNCPLQFYLEHVANIKPDTTISEDVEQKIVGSAAHDVLSHVAEEIIKNKDFNAIINKNLRDEVLEHNVHDAMQDAILKDKGIENKDADYIKIDFDHGKLYLASVVTKEAVKSYLQLLKKDLTEHFKDANSYKLVATEKKLKAIIDVGGNKIKLKGYADRIDLRNNKIAILDYKTGKVDEKNLKCNDDISEIFVDPQYKQMLQLLMYAYLYEKNIDASAKDLPKSDEYACGIISFQKMYMKQPHEIYPLFKYKDSEGQEIQTSLISKELLSIFEEYLRDLLSDIFNEEKDFTQAEDPDRCKYCDYANICCKQNHLDE